MHAEHRLCRTTGLDPLGTDQRAEHDAAGFGLPPGVDDRAALLTDLMEVPFPRFRVDRLTDGAEQSDTGAGSFLQRFRTFTHQGAQGGRSGVENVHLVLVDHLPEARGARVARHAFEDQRRGAVGQRTVDNVAVPRDPADVGGAPEHFAVAVIEHVLEGHRRLQQVAAGGVQHAFGFAGAAGGVEDEQRVFGVHRFGRAVVADVAQRLVIPDVPAFNPAHFILCTLDHHHGAHVRTALQRLVDVLFQRHEFAAAHAFIGGDHGAAVGVEYPVAQRVRGETAEHHRMHRTDPRAGEHGVGRFGNHRHVDAHAVAFLHATAFEHVGQAADVVMEFFVGDLGGFGGIVAFPDDRDLIAAFFQVPVDAVVADVQLSAGKPVGLTGFQVIALDGVPRLAPVEEAGGLFGPERSGVFNGFAVQAVVVVLTQLCSPADGIGFGERADIEHDGSLFLFCDKDKDAPSRERVQGWPEPVHNAFRSIACSR
ncbi:hypothetical protein D3C71_1097050 [compost metagenome]